MSDDYDELLIKGLHLPRKFFSIIDLPKGDRLPENEDYAGIVISGSGKMLTDGLSWLNESANWLKMQAGKNIPILGICFGHQLLGYAFGGKVADNPYGIEVGTKKINFNKQANDDLLFKDFLPSISAQVSHVQSVISLPDNSIVLASSEMEPHQVFRIKNNIWGLQFHPEFDDEVIKKLIISKDEKYPGKINVENLLAEVKETPQSYRILRKFGEIVIENLTQRHKATKNTKY